MRHLLIGGAAAMLAAASLAAGPAPARAAAPASQPRAGAHIVVPPLAYKARVLKNGLRFYSMRDPKAATVGVYVWYGVGGRDDPRGRSGFAHLFEHMMFRDTRDMSAEQNEALITDAGGTFNGSTLFDYTVYNTDLPANHLEQALWREGERLSGLVIDKAGFEAERHVVEEELRQRIYAQPYGRILYILQPKFVYSGHPYALEIGGSIADLDAATAEDARAFHEAFYRPDNATVVVSGRFDQAELDRWADKYLGSIPRPATPLVKDRAPAPEGAQAKSVTFYAPNVPLPAVIQAWHAPRAADPDFAAIQVLENLLGQGAGSRLSRALIHDQGLASRVYVSNLAANDGGVFAPTVILAPGKTVDQADAALSAEIARLRDAPVPTAELDRVKNQMLADALRDRETASGRAFALGSGAGVLDDPAWSDRMLAAVSALTPQDLQRVARRYLAEDRRVDIHYMDESQRASGPAETPLPPRPDVGRPPWAPTQAPVALLPENQRQAPPPAAPEQPAQPPLLAERTLKNGLRVVVAKSTDAPLASLALAVDAGSSSDPVGKAGVSALTAELLMRGTRSKSAAEVQDAMGALGATLNAHADADGAVVALSSPAANLDAAAGLMAEVVRSPGLKPEEFERQRSTDLAQLSEAMSQPRQIALRLLEPLTYGAAPYGRIASEASLKALAPADVQAQYAARWRPDNATLVIAGGLDPQAGFALAEKLFGGWARPAGPAPARPAPSPAAGQGRVIVVDLPKSGQTAVLTATPAVRRTDPAFLPLNAGDIVLSKAINQEVRVKRGLSYGGGAQLVGRRSGGHILALSQTKNASAPEVAGLILGEIGTFGAEPIDATELHKRVALLAGIYSQGLDTSDGVAQALTELVEAGAPTGEIATYATSLLAQTPAQAQAAARSLDLKSTSLLIVGDSSQFLDELKKRYLNVEVLRLEDLKADPLSIRKR